LFYCKNPSVGAGHTFTWAGSGGKAFSSLRVAGFNNTNTAANADQTNGATSGGAASLATGSVTPSTNDQLVIAACAHEKASATINSGFTEIDDVAYVGGAAIGGMMAYKVQTTAAAVNPTFTIPSSGAIAVAIATFKKMGT
jgi:hypothetical protein